MERIKLRISIDLDCVPAVLTGRALQSLEGHGGIVVAWRAVGLQAAGGSLLEVPAGADTRDIGAWWQICQTREGDEISGDTLTRKSIRR